MIALFAIIGFLIYCLCKARNDLRALTEAEMKQFQVIFLNIPLSIVTKLESRTLETVLKQELVFQASFAEATLTTYRTSVHLSSSFFS